MPLWPLIKEVMDFVAQCIFDGQTMLTWILRTHVFLLVFFQQMYSWKLHIALTTPADALVHHLQSHSFVKGNLVQSISRKKTLFKTEDFIKSVLISKMCPNLSWQGFWSPPPRPLKEKKNLIIQLFVKHEWNIISKLKSGPALEQYPKLNLLFMCGHLHTFAIPEIVITISSWLLT